MPFAHLLDRHDVESKFWNKYYTDVMLEQECKSVGAKQPEYGVSVISDTSG